jgi:large subunit ribosomal protein L25
MDTELLTARLREESGSRAARRLRRAGEIPAILIGQGKEPVQVAVPSFQFAKILRERTQLVTLDLGEERVEALVREVQFDTFGEKVLHVDFDRVTRGEELELEVPIEFFGDPAGSAEGGVFETRRNSLEIVCLPSAIPEKIEVDVTGLEIGAEILARDLTLPEGVTLVGDTEEDVIAVLAAPEIEVEEEAEEAEEGEPEILTEKKSDEEKEDQD